jgi:hypothetical protein
VVVELGFVNTWLIVPPEDALAPVIPPGLVPIVQAKLPGALDVKVILGLVPLQVLAVLAFVTAGFGFTVTVIGYTAPTQFPVVAVGVTLYTILPAVALLGLVSV